MPERKRQIKIEINTLLKTLKFRLNSDRDQSCATPHGRFR